MPEFPWLENLIGEILGLFTPEEQAAALWLLLITLGATHTFKIAWRYLVQNPRHGLLYLVSASVAIATSPFVWPPASAVHWAFAGLVMGPAANLLFRLAAAFIRRFVPWAWPVVNVDRRKPKNRNVPPPDGIERRGTV